MVGSLLETLTLIDVHSVTNVIGESISSMQIWNIVNQYGKYNCFSYEMVENNLKEKILPAQMDINHFGLILARRYWNCFSIENVRCFNYAASAVMMK